MLEKSLSSTHSFDIELARDLGGIELAVLVHHINFWIKFNERAGKNLYEGRYWMYQTIEEMSHHFPYWSEKQIRSYLLKLVEKGIIIKGNFNKSKMDQTCWYTIDFKKIFTICPNGKMEFTKQKNAEDQLGKPIPDTKTNTEKDSKTNIFAQTASPLRNREFIFSFEKEEFEGIREEDFEDWKSLYPTVDLKREFIEMKHWILANPAKVKSKKLWRRFITSWLSKTNDKNINKQAYQSTKQNGATSGSLEKNYALAKKCHTSYESKTYIINLLSKEVEFTPKGAGQPICLSYSELGFSEQLENIMRKCQFKKKEYTAVNGVRYNKNGQKIDEDGNLI